MFANAKAVLSDDSILQHLSDQPENQDATAWRVWTAALRRQVDSSTLNQRMERQLVWLQMLLDLLLVRWNPTMLVYGVDALVCPERIESSNVDRSMDAMLLRIGFFLNQILVASSPLVGKVPFTLDRF
jgi:hypothetical protein